MRSFADMWWRIGTVMNWQSRMQPALAVIVQEYKDLVR